MVQGGDPTGTGRGGESIYGGKFADEIHPGLKHTGAGIIAMANSGPNTNGSQVRRYRMMPSAHTTYAQFYITLAPTPHLDNKHAVFGRVCSGMDVIQRMGNVQTNKSDKPTVDVKILKATPL